MIYTKNKKPNKRKSFNKSNTLKRKRKNKKGKYRLIGGVIPENKPQLSIRRNLESTNYKNTCYLSTPLISLLAFNNSYLINQLEENKGLTKAEHSNKICHNTSDILDLLEDVHNDLIDETGDSNYVYGEINGEIPDGFPYGELFYLIYPNCSDLGLKPNGKIGDFGESGEALEFLVKVIYSNKLDDYCHIQLAIGEKKDNVLDQADSAASLL